MIQSLVCLCAEDIGGRFHLIFPRKKRLIFIVISRLIYKYYMYVIVLSYKLSALLWRSHPKNTLCQKFVHPKDPVVRHEE